MGSFCLWFDKSVRVVRSHHTPFLHIFLMSHRRRALPSLPRPQREAQRGSEGPRGAQGLVPGARAGEWLSWDLDAGLSDSEICVVIQLKVNYSF